MHNLLPVDSGQVVDKDPGLHVLRFAALPAHEPLLLFQDLVRRNKGNHLVDAVRHHLSGEGRKLSLRLPLPVNPPRMALGSACKAASLAACLCSVELCHLELSHVGKVSG